MEESDIARRVSRMAALRGDLHTVLTAHLETRAVLTPEQIARYKELRGYQEESAPPPPHRHH